MRFLQGAGFSLTSPGEPHKILFMPKLRRIAKLTSKNQLTLPAAIVAELGHPSHFRVQVTQGALILFPARLASDEEVLARLTQDGMDATTVQQVRDALRPK